MADIRPFRALRPRSDLAARVASPPYDVIDSAEARAMASGNPDSFLHVIKPEIDLPEETGLYDDVVYQTGASNLADFVARGILEQDEEPHLYVYEQTMGDHVQVGLVAGASVAEYDAGTIKKHEKTRQGKEDDRTRHVDTLDAQTGPVFLTYRQRDGIDRAIADVCAGEPANDFVADDGIRHRLWVVRDSDSSDALIAAFADIDTLYIADGHHRSASASRVARKRRENNRNHSGDEAYNYFLTVIFPDDQMKILDYNRVVADLAGMSSEQLLAKVSDNFDISESSGEKPSAPNHFKMFLQGEWYELVAKPGTFPEGDPVASLDVSILQDNLLAPILGIGDPRTDERIDFVGGIRGTAELAKRAGDGVAFALYPTSMDQLIAIADAGEIMPPKSTWFEPKLRSGLVVRPLSDDG